MLLQVKIGIDFCKESQSSLKLFIEALWVVKVLTSTELPNAELRY